MKKLILALICSLIGAFGLIGSASAGVITYESLPAGNSANVSHHTSGGPVLAADFTPAYGGKVVQLDWWGANAGSQSWEITFHIDNSGQPGAMMSQHIVTAAGSDLDNDQIFLYTAAWNPADVALTAGTDYWFSVANFAPGWTWANGNLPTVGSEKYAGMVSRVASGSPHFGPWVGTGTDFAFRIHVVAEPSVIMITGLGLLLISLPGRKRNSV